MSSANLMEESQLLQYASLIIDLVGILRRYMDGIVLTNYEQKTIEKSIRFLNSALSGQMLIYRKRANLAPDEESVEKYDYVSAALEQVDDQVEQRSSERSEELLTDSLLVLQQIKEGVDPSQIKKEDFNEAETLFRKMATGLVQKSAAIQDEESGSFNIFGASLQVI